MSNSITFYENLKLLFLIAGCTLAGIAVIEFFSFRILRIIRMRLYRSGLLKFHPEEEIGKKAILPDKSTGSEGIKESGPSGALSGSLTLKSGSLERAKEDVSNGAEETSLLDENLSRDKNISEGTEETSLLSNDRAIDDLLRENSTRDKPANRKLSRDNLSSSGSEDNFADGSEETGLLHSDLSQDNSVEEIGSEAEGAAPTSLLQEEGANPTGEEDGSAATSLLTEEAGISEPQPDLSRDKFSYAESAAYEETSGREGSEEPKHQDSPYDDSESTALLNNGRDRGGSHTSMEYKDENVFEGYGEGSDSTTLLKEGGMLDEASAGSDGTEDTALLRDTGSDETNRGPGGSLRDDPRSLGRTKPKYPGFVIDTEDIVTHDNE